MNNSIDLGIPEMESLRDYLQAVRDGLDTAGASEADYKDIEGEILAHVVSQLGSSGAEKLDVDAIVCSLDPPESYVEAFSESSEKTGQGARKRRIRPWMLICGLLAGGVILFLALVIIGFTTMVSYRNRVVEAEKNIDQTVSQVEVVLQRRFDLIPNLVETVKGYADHESEVFREVARLRGQWSQSDSPEERQRISVELDPKLNEILVVAEQYPNLKANRNFRMLQVQLEGTENRIAVERRRMNLAIREYNILIEKFPGNVVAALFDYEPRVDYFEAVPESRNAPEVDF